jgi:hypothetical protein
MGLLEGRWMKKIGEGAARTAHNGRARKQKSPQSVLWRALAAVKAGTD